ncbi:MAG: glucosamine-6-phosphate deaminase [Actinomycetota bacterium]
MELIITENYEHISKKAANIIADKVKKKPACVLGFATGHTPMGTYKELIRLHKEDNLDFSKVRAFNLDEYFGISMDLAKPYPQDQSYQRFMHEELFKHINIQKENTHIPNGLTKDPESFCLQYEEEIKKAGGIDLQLLGLGRNGHLAFNEPGSSLASRTRLKALAKKTLDDNYKKFYQKAGIKKEKMPRHAITMGVGTILETKHALMIVSGKSKAKIVADAIEGCITSRVPASAMQLHPGKVTVILDRDSASMLTWSLDMVQDDVC